MIEIGKYTAKHHGYKTKKSCDHIDLCWQLWQLWLQSLIILCDCDLQLPVCFLIDLACQKLAVKVANDDHVTLGLSKICTSCQVPKLESHDCRDAATAGTLRSLVQCNYNFFWLLNEWLLTKVYSK